MSVDSLPHKILQGKEDHPSAGHEDRQLVRAIRMAGLTTAVRLNTETLSMEIQHQQQIEQH